MRPRLLAITLLTIIIVLSGGRLARAETSVPAPTPSVPAGVLPAPPSSRPTQVPTESRKAPAAGDLLARMRAAMVKQDSVHVDFQMVSALYPAGEATTRLRGDISWKLNLLHDRTIVRRTDPGHAGAAPLRSIDLRLVHRRVASRDQAGGWQCTNMPHVQVMSTLLGLEETVLSAHVVGAVALDGISDWEVQATGYSPATGSGVVAHIIYDISQADGTLQRVQVTGSTSFDGRTQQVVASESYTHYGETVRVRLPSACVVH